MTNSAYVLITLTLIGWIIVLFRNRTAYKRRLVRIADREWNKWGRQYMEDNRIYIEGSKETDEDFVSVVGDYWQSIGENYDGNDTDTAWSSAFIGHILTEAGAEDIPTSASHSVYIRYAVNNRKQGRTNANYVAYRKHEKEAEVGDLVCYSREAQTDLYDRTGSYKSHCDLVVKKGRGYVDVIGGNVSDGVTKKKVSTSNGRILDLNNKWFAIIKNNQKF